jgi:hypothetical protein
MDAYVLAHAHLEQDVWQNEQDLGCDMLNLLTILYRYMYVCLYRYIQVYVMYQLIN